MFIVNPEVFDVSTLYACNILVRNWLVYSKNIPVFGKGVMPNIWYFSKTKELDDALADMPEYLKELTHINS